MHKILAAATVAFLSLVPPAFAMKQDGTRPSHAECVRARGALVDNNIADKAVVILQHFKWEDQAITLFYSEIAEEVKDATKSEQADDREVARRAQLAVAEMVGQSCPIEAPIKAKK